MLAGGLLELAVRDRRRRATRWWRGSSSTARHRGAAAGAAVPSPRRAVAIRCSSRAGSRFRRTRPRARRPRASPRARMPRGGSSRSGRATRYRDVAEQAMRSVAGIAVERPLAFGGALELMARLASPLVQLVTVVPDSPNDATSDERHRATADGGDDADRSVAGSCRDPAARGIRRDDRDRAAGPGVRRSGVRAVRGTHGAARVRSRPIGAVRSCARCRCTRPVRSRRSSILRERARRAARRRAPLRIRTMVA